MTILSTALLVLFIITCFIIVLLVLVQNEEGDSIGGLFAGSSNSAFGARSSNILTKITQIGVIVFFALTILLGLSTRSKDADFESDIQDQQIENSKEWWKDADSGTDSDSSENNGAIIEDASDSTDDKDSDSDSDN
ncbi:MAG: preprotein translocase subunit SecG [Treponema sp.]|nr:MAG: preprotein translocase subunit SecG [Treponema sp.]